MKKKLFNSRKEAACPFRSVNSLIICRQKEHLVLSIAFTLEFIILKANMERQNAKLEAISYVIYYSEVMNLEIRDLYLAVKPILFEG